MHGGERRQGQSTPPPGDVSAAISSLFASLRSIVASEVASIVAVTPTVAVMSTAATSIVVAS